MPATGPTCTPTPPARSRARWPRAAESTPSGWRQAGTAPTACSVRSTLGDFRDERLREEQRAPMKVLMVSWEYPPVVVGGLGRHVYQLATALAADGHEVVVLSRRPTGTHPRTHPSTAE